MSVIAYVLIQVNSGSEEEVCEKIVDFEEVWLVVKEEIPKLKPLIKKVLEDLETGEK